MLVQSCKYCLIDFVDFFIRQGQNALVFVILEESVLTVELIYNVCTLDFFWNFHIVPIFAISDVQQKLLEFCFFLVTTHVLC